MLSLVDDDALDVLAEDEAVEVVACADDDVVDPPLALYALYSAIVM